MVHVIFFFSTLLSALSSRYGKQILLFTFFILFIFAAIRYGYGNDYFSYKEIYNLINANNDVYTEPLYNQINKLCPSFEYVVVISSICSILPAYYLISRYVCKTYQWLSVFIFVFNPYIFLMGLSAIRQTMALSLFIIAINFSKNKRILPYIVCIILAVLIHESAIILLPFYFLANKKHINIWWILIILLGILLMLVYGEDITNSILVSATQIINPDYVSYILLGESNSLRAIILTSITLIYIAINIPHLSGHTLMFSKLYFVGCVFNMFAYYMNMLTRFQMYFDIFSIVSIPMILFQNNTQYTFKNEVALLINKYIFPILIFVIYGLRYYSFFTNPLWESFYVYHTILYKN